ncbi:ankyrin repeats [Ceratobasidium sp. AG-Ba]|nr:ankyrin repeats [Ceratobasidium sp. AG-Ba]QRW01903.1 ankyrin repeats [Ceratobasidium sp. AG-Ba]
MSNAPGDPLSTIHDTTPSPAPVPVVAVEAPEDDDDDEEFIYPGSPEPPEPAEPISDPLSTRQDVPPLAQLAIPSMPESQPQSPQPTSTQLDAIYNAAAAGSLLELQNLFAADTRIPAFALANDAAPRTGLTALHAAASRGRLAVVRWLVEECGAMTDLEDKEGETSLHKAALHGHLSVVTYLLSPQGKADVHAQDGDGWTALHNACSKGYLDIVRFMCESAGAADQLDSGDGTVRGVDIKSRGGWTPLMNAASKGHLPVVLYLLTKQAADPMIRNNWGETAYDIAAAVFEVWICEVLQKAEADRWQGSQTVYNPLGVHTTVPLILHELQRLDVRLKTLAVSGGRPKFSASGLGKNGRRGPFELCLPTGLQVSNGNSQPSTPTTPNPSGSSATNGATGTNGAAGSTQSYVKAWRSDVALPLLEQPFVLPAPVPGKTREGAERSHFWLSDWTLDLTHPRVNATEGWQYARSFDDPDDKWTADPPAALDKLLQGAAGMTTGMGGSAVKWVRRRRWVRVMRRRLDIPPLPFMEPSGMYHVAPDGGMIPAGEEGGEEMGVMGTGSGQDYVSRARYVVGELESPAEGMGGVDYGRRVAKLERAVNDLRVGLADDSNADRRKQAERLLEEYVRELERTRAAAAAAGHNISADDPQDTADDDDSDGSFHYPGSPTSTARPPSVRSHVTNTTDYFTQPRRGASSSATPHDLTQLAQAPEFRVPTHEAPQKVHTPHWTPPTPHSIQTRWEPDEAVGECRGCRRRFTWLLRKHHCRRCGQIFCDRCSSRRAVLDPSDVVLEPSMVGDHYAGGSSTHRVCEPCYDITTASVGVPRSLRTPERIVVDSQNLLTPNHLRSQESSQISDLAE